MDDQWYLYTDTKTGPPESISLKLLKMRARRLFAPPTTNTCSNDYPITLAGQSIREYGKAPVNLGAGGGYFISN
jgi:hypothetical protein